MNDEYLWDKSGPVQPDVRKLESALNVLGFRADAFIPEALLAKLAPQSLSAPTFSSLETPPLAVRLAHLARTVVADFRRSPKDFVKGLLFDDDDAVAAAGPLWRRLHAQVEYNSAALARDPGGYWRTVTAATKRDRQRRRTLGWSFLFSFFLFTTTLVGVCALPLFAPPPDLAAKDEDPVQVISMLEPLPPLPPPPTAGSGVGLRANAAGGGGGGKSDPTPASKGRAPEATLNDFERIVDPTTKPSAIDTPSLPVAPKIKAPDEFRPNLTQPVGVPNGASGPPSDGNGPGSGIGDNGKGDGVGSGDGSGAGRGGNAGGGVGGGTGSENGGGATLRPAILSKSKPKYTEEGRANKIQGKVVLSVEFRADGTIGNVTVIRSLGYGLDENAIAAARQIRFTPAMVNGAPKTIVSKVEYTFSLL
jgi:TonB family protein